MTEDLLKRVQEVWNTAVTMIPLAGGIKWLACRELNIGDGLVLGSGATEEEALRAALRAAIKPAPDRREED